MSVFTFAPMPRFRPYTTAGVYRAILSDLALGRWDDGDSVADLERTMCAHLSIPNALFAPQARVAIHLAVKAAIRQTGRRRIVMSPYTIFDVVNMVVSAGGEPVFADLDGSSCNIAADEAEKLVDDQTAAVMITHIHGLAADVQRFRQLCDEAGILLIEDAAQALGTTVDGRQVGTFGDIGIFSFGLAKNVNSFLGGMVVTRDAALDAGIREELGTYPVIARNRLLNQVIFGLITDLTLHPALFKPFCYWLFRMGYLHNIDLINKRVTVEDNPVLRRDVPTQYKVRPSPAQARLVMAQLPGLDEQVRLRIAAGDRYYQALKGIPELQLAPHASDGRHSYMSFALQVADRHALLRHLMAKRRDCAVQHLKNCADLPCFSEWSRDCPNARRTANQTLILPTYPRYGAEEIDRTIEAVRDFFGA